MNYFKVSHHLFFFLLLTVSCGSLNNSYLSGQPVGITLLIQNPDESAKGTAKAVDGPANDFAVSKAVATLSVTSCDTTCGGNSKSVSFASGASSVEAILDCPTGSSVTVSAECADTSKKSNGVNFGFGGSTSINLSSSKSATATITGRFLNQATRSSGDCRYVRVAQDNNTQMSVECGFNAALTDSQKGTAQCNVEYDASKGATSPGTVDTSGDGLQATRSNPYIIIDGGLIAPSCFQYNSSGAKELRGTGSWETDSDGNTKAVCKFGVRQWSQFDSDRNFHYAASCTKDDSTWVLLPSSEVAEGKTSPATDGDVSSLAATNASCSTPRACSSGFCSTNSLCAAVPSPASGGVAADVAGPVEGGGAGDCSGSTCPAGTANGAATSAQFSGPGGVCISPDGNSLYVVDTTNEAIRKIDLTLATTSSSYVTTFCGQIGTTGSTNGACTSAAFSTPSECVVNAGNTSLFVTEQGNDVIREIVIATSQVSTFAGSGTAGFTNGTGTAATFDNPDSIAIDSNGTLYVEDETNKAIRKITSGGVVTTLAGGGSCFNNNTTRDGEGSQACFATGMGGIVLDDSGTFLYVASGTRIRIVNTATQIVSTLATGLSGPFNIAIDPTGDTLYITTTVNVITKLVISTAAATTLAGSSGTAGFTNGTGSSARFNNPTVIVMNPVGDTLYLVDSLLNKVRKIQ